MIHAATSAPQSERFAPNASLVERLRHIVRRAFAAQPAADLLLLRLADQHRLTAGEIARMWGCEEAAVAQAAAAARRRIADEILSKVDRTEPRLQLGWGDVIAVCQRALAAGGTGAAGGPMTLLRAEARRPFTHEPACAR